MTTCWSQKIMIIFRSIVIIHSEYHWTVFSCVIVYWWVCIFKSFVTKLISVPKKFIIITTIRVSNYTIIVVNKGIIITIKRKITYTVSNSTIFTNNISKRVSKYNISVVRIRSIFKKISIWLVCVPSLPNCCNAITNFRLIPLFLLLVVLK